MAILKDVADALLEKTISFDVDIIQVSKIDRLLRRPSKKTFSIRPPCLAVLIKISTELLEVNTESFQSNTDKILESNFILIKEQAARLAKIIAIAVSNPRQEPDKSLVDFFLHNLTPMELHRLINIVIQQMDIMSFMRSIILVKGTTLLKSPKVNPQSQRG